MEFTKEFIEENQLSADQVTAITGQVATHVGALKQEWDGVANENAEKIISGAASKVEETTGIKREQGQKIADYLAFAGEKYLEGSKASLERKEKELDAKIKAGGGDETLKAQLTETKEQLDALKQKEAKFKEWEENDYKGKYTKAQEDLTSMQRKVAYNTVKPSFPDTVNSYEANAKWRKFVQKVEAEYDTILDANDEPVAVDKKNTYISHKLKDLVAKDEDISKLLEGRKVVGPGADPNKKQIKIEGLPFAVPENATAEERQKAIKDYLAGQNIPKTEARYATEFKRLNLLILGKNPAK